MPSVHEAPASNRPADEEARSRALEAVVYQWPGAPTVAQVAETLGWSTLEVAEEVGAHYWMFLGGDLRTTETARVFSDGE